MVEVIVEAEWRTTHPIEFETEAEADEFRSRMWLLGAGEKLDAILEHGDITPDHTAELINWDVE